MAISGKKKSKREPHQKKKVPTQKSMRGRPEYYSELKKLATFSLTPTAKAGLNLLSRTRSISMSELIEQIGREVIKLADGKDSGNI